MAEGRKKTPGVIFVSMTMLKRAAPKGIRSVLTPHLLVAGPHPRPTISLIRASDAAESPVGLYSRPT
jgi:hypothetical protein